MRDYPENCYISLVAHCTDFSAKDEWPANSPDLNPLDYYVWGAMLQAFHKLIQIADDHSGAKKCTAAMGRLAADNDQQSYLRLSQTSELEMHAFRQILNTTHIFYEIS